MSYKLLGELESLLETYTVSEIVDGLGKICEDNASKYESLANSDYKYYPEATQWRKARDLLIPLYRDCE
jgi:hypothetical protein